MKWREQKPTSTYILKLCRNSTGVHYFVTEASSRCHCHCRCRCSPLATTTTVVAPWLHRRRLRRHHIVIGTAITTVFPPLFCDLFDCYVVVSSPLYCRAFLLLLHPFHHVVAAANARLRVVVVVIIIAVVAPAIPLPSPQSRASTLPVAQRSAPRGSSSSDWPSATGRRRARLARNPEIPRDRTRRPTSSRRNPSSAAAPCRPSSLVVAAAVELPPPPPALF
jgi:hypothetical protein